MTLDEFVERAGPVPFKDRGRDWDGWDCFGLVYVFYRDVRGIIIPDFLDQYKGARRHKEIDHAVHSNMRYWRRLSRGSEGPGSGVLMSVKRRPVHIGLLINKNDIMHCEEDINTIVENRNCLMMGHRVLGYYRYIEDEGGNPA